MAIIKPNNNTLSAITALPTGLGGKVLQVVEGTCQGRINIVRGSTEIIDGDVYIDGESNTYDPKVGAKIFLSKLDSPSTTSSTTYKVQVKSVSSSYSPTIAFSANNTSTITLIEISA